MKVNVHFSVYLNFVFKNTKCRSLSYRYDERIDRCTFHREFKFYLKYGKRNSLSYQDDRINRSILKNMGKAGYLTHVRRLDLYLEEASAESGFTLEDLADMFDFCPSLTHLSIYMSWECSVVRAVKMTSFEGMASKLKKGFGRLERVKLRNCLRRLFLNSWSVYQEILT
jgi:hypothetical protein